MVEDETEIAFVLIKKELLSLILSARLACDVSASVLHLSRSAAALEAMRRLSTLILRSFSSVRRHVFWSSPLSLALRCPSEGCSGDGVGGHAVDMS